MKKFTLKATLLSLSTTLLLGIAGCSSGGSDDPVTQAVAKAFSGTAIDGILVGSTVCIDVNKNNTCDVGEPSAITDDRGQFSIPETTATGPLLLIGGVDNSTGEAFTGSLKAPAGSSVVTPLTSAIQSLVEGGKSAEDAESNVKAAMGLTGVDVNLTSFDPYNEVSANAQAVLAKQTQLQVLVHSATVTVAGADSGTDVNSTMSSVFDAIVGNFDGATGEVQLDAATVSAATKAAADEVYKDNQAARVAAKVVAQTSAENSVRDADSAKNDISSGTPEQAQAKLDAAIAKANSTAEDELRKAAVDAKAAADAAESANAEALNEIERLQRLQQEKEAEIAAAKKAEQDALDALAAAKAAVAQDALDRVKYEAYLEAQAAAEKAAKEKAEADLAAAEAAAAAAEKEVIIAAEAAQRQAEAEAAAAQAQAKADAAQARLDAADAAAQAAADQEKTLQEAQEAVAVAQAAAAHAVAQAEVNANVQIAKFHASQAAAAATDTQLLAALEITGNLADANVTTAVTAAAAAAQAAIDANITIPDDNNISTSIEFKNEAAKQALLATTALEDAYKIKADAELIAAAQQVLNAKLNRITAIKSDITDMFSDVNATLQRLSTSDVTDNLNTIRAIATAYPANIELQSALTAANNADTAGESAYTQAQDALRDIELKITLAEGALSDVNETAAVNAKDQALEAKSLFETLFEVATKKAEEIVGIRTAVEELRDIEIGNEQSRVEAAILLSKNTAQQSLDTAVSAAQDANASAVAAGISATTAGTIASTNSNAASFAQAALTAAQTAQTQAQESATAANLASAEMTRVFVTELATISESKALSAAELIADYKESAVTAKNAAILAKIAAATALTSAQNVEVPSSTSLAFTDGTVFGDFSVDSEVEAHLFTLNGAPTGSATVERLLLGEDGLFAIDTSPSTDLEYKNGNWIAETNTGAYTINADGSVTLENGDMIKIVSAIDLATPNSLNTLLLDQINQAVPGDNVTFRSGAKSLVFAEQKVESFHLWWTPKDYDTNNTYASLLDFMNSDSPVGGVETADGFEGVYFQKNSDKEAIDDSNTSVSRLENALSGKLVKFTPDAVVVGTWGVTDLPNGDLILALTAIDLASFGDSEFDNLVAVANGSVMVGEMKAATTSFVTDEENVHFNQTAFEDIKGAIETYAQSTSPLAFLLGGKTLWSQVLGDHGEGIENSLEKQIFNADATEANWIEIINPEGTLCEGNVSITFEVNQTITVAVIDEICTDPTPPGTTFNIPVEADISWNYILVNHNKWYFNEQDARDDFLSTTVPIFDLSTYIVGSTQYYIDNDGLAAQYTFDANGSLSGIDSTGSYGGESYTILDNNLTNVTAEGTFTFRHFATTSDGKGQMFEVYNGTVYLGEVVLYVNADDRDAELTPSSIFSIVGDWGEVDAPNVGLFLRLAVDGNFDTNDTGALEHGTYVLNVTNNQLDGNPNGTITFNVNDDNDSTNGLFRGDTNVTYSITVNASGNILALTNEANSSIQYGLDKILSGGASSNTPPVAQDDVYVTMLVGETLTGVVSATDIDVGDNLSFDVYGITSGFAPGTELNMATGAFTVVSGNSANDSASITIRVSDDANSSDYVIYHVNIIEPSVSNSDEGSYSKSDETITAQALEDFTPTDVIPGDTPLHSFWGIDNGHLQHDIMEFNTSTLQVMFSDNDEEIYYTDTLSSGVLSASLDPTGGDSSYNEDNRIIIMKLLQVEENSTLLSNELNMTMPSGSVAYKSAVVMTQDEFDFWGEAKNYSTGVEDGLVYNSLDDLVAYGIAAQDHKNNNRALVFDKNSSSTNLVEVDFSGFFATGNLADIYVINPNAGAWGRGTQNILGKDIIFVYPTDTQRFQTKIYVLNDYGVNGDTSNITNSVWEGEFKAAGNIKVQYQYNDTAAQAIVDSLSSASFTHTADSILNGAFAYVANEDESTIYKIDENGSFSTLLSGYNGVSGLVKNVSDNKLYFSDDDNKIYSLDVNKNVTELAINSNVLSNPNALEISGNYLFIANAGDSIVRVNLADLSDTQVMVTGLSIPQAVRVDGDTLYFTDNNRALYSVAKDITSTVTDISSLKIVDLPIADTQGGLAIDAEHNIYMSDYSGGKILKISATDNTVTTIYDHVATQPRGLFYRAEDNSLYATVFNDATVIRIDLNATSDMPELFSDFGTNTGPFGIIIDSIDVK